MGKAFKVKVHTTQYKSKKNDSVDNYIHQTSPGWTLTFVRWANRDTFRYAYKRKSEESKYKAETTIQPLSTLNEALVVSSDCISLVVQSSKSTHTPSMSATLKGTDINYLTAIAPGDFVFVNIFDWEKEIDSIIDAVKNRKPINGLNSGFKGVFKVQSVRMVARSNRSTGEKTLYYQITAYGFTEFNNTIYFNDQSLNPAIDKNDRAAMQYFTRTGIEVNELAANGPVAVQTVLKKIVQLILTGPGARFENDQLVTPNTIYRIPRLVFDLLGIKSKTKTAIEMYKFLFGIQEYQGTSEKTDIISGLIPSNLADKNPDPSKIFIELKDKCKGLEQLKIQYWHNVVGWALMSEHANLLLNEMYTTYRVGLDGSIYPTVVFRQKPFSTEKPIVKNAKVTKFLNLPRWNIPAEMIFDINIGRDEALRNNFVQIFSNLTGVIGGGSIGSLAEQAKNNWVADFDDIQRSGLRPYIQSTNHDIPFQQGFQSPTWAKILADMIFGQHLKLTGNVVCAGIFEPISVGDNAQIGDVVYHIETVIHTCEITPDGRKKFETQLALSNGVSEKAENSILRYSQMENSDMTQELQSDYDNKYNIYPGISSAQFSNSRESNGETKKLFLNPSFEPEELQKNTSSISDEDVSIKKSTNKK